ncbi:hypothetical protein AG1IA_06860 [Rhizoctonia solani AG-1 IA]|uniref:Uncharacterized protein n=1 Tax=Thanatephorus cucumeris (strain AG1-IA) TaxID=983506 RepID=L8WLR3_THACA|nr:hypothetical protein AG1IA_06860 [Rhizoctonia solani AG-1 IA]
MGARRLCTRRLSGCGASRVYAKREIRGWGSIVCRQSTRTVEGVGLTDC